ncbi:MAG: DUF1223 domain-containing protein [Methylophilaceae bacterium]
MRKIILTVFASSLVLSLFQPVNAAVCQATSGAQRVSLLELYTSEGCSSCPPADKWLSNLKPDATHVIPLAFHVDYWDYIGWKDQFSKAEFSVRQRKTAALAGAGFVYTPQFILNGHDYKTGSEALGSASADGKKSTAPAALNLSIINQNNGALLLKTNALLTDAVDSKYAEVFVAIYENKLVSQVKAGENNGRELKHDYVVRQLFGAYPVSNKTFSKDFILNPSWKSRPAGVVMFVQNSKTGEILQSLQLPLCS